MGGVQDRVKEFLESVKKIIPNIEMTAICSHCGVELTDGNFAVVDGKLFCLSCRAAGPEGTLARRGGADVPD